MVSQIQMAHRCLLKSGSLNEDCRKGSVFTWGVRIIDIGFCSIAVCYACFLTRRPWAGFREEIRFCYGEDSQGIYDGLFQLHLPG